MENSNGAANCARGKLAVASQAGIAVPSAHEFSPQEAHPRLPMQYFHASCDNLAIDTFTMGNRESRNSINVELLNIQIFPP